MDKGTTPAAGKRLVRPRGARYVADASRDQRLRGKLSRKAASALRHRRASSRSRSTRHDRERQTRAGATPAGHRRHHRCRQVRRPGRAARTWSHRSQLRRNRLRADGPLDPRQPRLVPHDRPRGRRRCDRHRHRRRPSDFQTPDWNGSRVIASAVTNPCAPTPKTSYGHGTHVAGLIAGNSLLYPTDDPLFGRYMGVAPRREPDLGQGLRRRRQHDVLDAIYGIQFAVDNKAELRHPSHQPVAVLDDGGVVPDRSARRRRRAGVVRGPRGRRRRRQRGADERRASPTRPATIPASSPPALSTTAAPRSWLDDIARAVVQPRPHAGRRDASRTCSHLAAGWSPRSRPDSDFARPLPDVHRRRPLLPAGGTSMATAVVSGAAALILEEHPSLDAHQVKGALVATLDDVPGAGRRRRCHGGTRLHRWPTATCPERLIDPATGLIDWTRASFRRASFRDASGSPLERLWSRASFRCDCGLRPPAARSTRHG